MLDNKKLMIRDKGGSTLINFNEIIYLQGKGMYTEIYLDDSRLVISKNIKCIEDKLPENIFIRIHQSYMVNINRIRNIILNGKSNIITDTGVELPISKTCKTKLKLVLENTYTKI